MIRMVRVLVLLVAAGFLSSACGYALAGRGNALPASIKTIGVPLFINRSTLPEVDHALTEAVLREFQSRGRYQVLPEAPGADAVLIGTVTAVTSVPVAFTTQNQVSRIMIVVTASLEFRETGTDRIIWANPSFRTRDEYDITTGTTANDPTALFRQDANALDRLARSFSKSVVTSIFEAF